MQLGERQKVGGQAGSLQHKVTHPDQGNWLTFFGSQLFETGEWREAGASISARRLSYSVSAAIGEQDELAQEIFHLVAADDGQFSGGREGGWAGLVGRDPLRIDFTLRQREKDSRVWSYS